MVRGAGIIVFKKTETRWNTILVTSKNGPYGFPKGKKLKGEKNLDAAYRELMEETGIQKQDITMYGKTSCDNSALYYVAIYNKNINTELIFDRNELESCDWYSVEDAIKLLQTKRKQILEESYSLILNKTKINNE
jgi:8-oxo-dGTP pyrophosphatase MutT (NUDIX family)